MPRLTPFLVALILFGTTTYAHGQECQTGPLPFEIEQSSALDGSDCTVRLLCGEESDSPCDGRGEFWVIQATAGDLVAVTVREGTGRPTSLIITDPVGGLVGDDQSLDIDCRCFRRSFTATSSGVYLARVATRPDRAGRQGTYTVRAQRVTVPLPGLFYVSYDYPVYPGEPFTFIGWAEFLSPSPVLEYVLELGSVSGAADLGVLSFGTATRLSLSSIPRGTYFVRVRARNALGWSNSTSERSVVGTSDSTSGPLLSALIAGRHVTLTWTRPPSANLAFYELHVSNVPSRSGLRGLSGSWEVVYNIGSVQSLEVPNVPNGYYYVQLRAVTTDGRREQSNEISVSIWP